MLINRRKLLVGLGGLIAAPAVVRAASLMPVRRPLFSPVRYVPLWDARTELMLEEWGRTLQRDEVCDTLYFGGMIIREAS